MNPTHAKKVQKVLYSHKEASWGERAGFPSRSPNEVAGEDGRGVFLVFRDWGQGEGRAQAGRDSCGSNVSQA